MKPLKPLEDLPQKSSPDYVLQIQDLPKRAPVDLMNFPEGSLRPSWGAPPLLEPSLDPPGIPLVPFRKIHIFVDNQENHNICNVWGT
jgi:hypothetical protein